MRPASPNADSYDGPWKNEVLGVFWADDKQLQLDRLAAHWVQETEDYDQRICHCFNERGLALPVTAEERHASHAFARELERDCLWIALQLGLGQMDWLAARDRAVRHFERQRTR